MNTNRIGLALALALLLPTLSPADGAASSPAVDPPSGEAPLDVDWLCDQHTKECLDVDPVDIGYPPLQGAAVGEDPTKNLDALRPYLGDPTPIDLVQDTYRDLTSEKPEDPLGDLPVQPPPTPDHLTVSVNASVGVRVDVDVNENVNEHVLGQHVHAHPRAHVHREVGATVQREVNVTLREEPGEPPAGDQVPCSDPRGCPDLVVDPSMLLVGTTVTRDFSADSCSAVEGSVGVGARRLLRFTFTSPNLGDGDLVIGDPLKHLEWFQWGECHGHWHFREYADYRLWTVEGYLAWRQARNADPDAMARDVLDAHPELQSAYVAGHKQGFCSIDVRPYAPVEPAKYTSCASKQGISRGWADEYAYGLDGQWIDVTDVPTGYYVLEAEVNPERLFRESDYTNNGGAALVLVQHATPIVLPPLP